MRYRASRCASAAAADKASRLERDLVVELLVEALAASAALAGKRSGASEIAAVARFALARAVALAPVEHGELCVEALQHHLGRVSLVVVVVGPFARLERAFQIKLGALLQILLGNLRQILVEDHHAVPFGFLATLTGRLVAPVLTRRH